MKLRHISAVATLAVLLPFAVSALTADDLQQQIQSLLSQISQLQQQLAQLTTTNPTSPACTMEAKICPDGTAVGRTGPNCEFAACPPRMSDPDPLPGNACPVFTRTIAQGATGDDVKNLQATLGVSQTGFFGPATARAVAGFQSEAGLEQVGIVGPQTRDALWRRCGGGGWNRNFSASPTSGSAPLTVTFAAGRLDTSGSYSIDFGDGSSLTLSPYCAQDEGPCPQGPNYAQKSHTYTQNGTYVAKLIYQQTFYCPTGAMCPAMMPMPKTVGTVTIYVGGSSSTGAPSISGIDGPAALNIGQTGTWTVRASVPNTADTNLRYSVVWGDEGVIGQLNAFAGNVPSAIWTSGSFTHAYQNAGTYKPVFTVSNSNGSAQASASVTVDTQMCTAMYRICPAGTHNGGRCDQDCIPDDTSNEGLTVSPTSGQAPLTVTVSFWGSSGCPSYTLTWGDGTNSNTPPPPPNMGCTAVMTRVQLTHTYTNPGTYTITLNGSQRQTVTVYGTPINPTGTLSASPTSGPAPLSVNFSYPYNSATQSGPYTVNFGDGTSGQMTPLLTMEACMQGTDCSRRGSWHVNHTYTAPGTYRATLTTAGACESGYCAQVHSVMITVVSGSWTNCGDGGCSYPVPPFMHPNATIVGQSSGVSTPAPATGSCVYNGQTYPNGALMSSAGTACTNPMGCGISSSYLVCQDGRSVVTLSPPTTSTSDWR